jgi:hypothetical protein
MEEKSIKRLFYLMITLSVCVTLISLFSDANRKLRFEFEFLIFIIWAISPYACLYLVDVGLRKIYSISNMSIFLLVVSTLMFFFTLMYFDGGVRKSSTDALKYLFVPFFLHIGWFAAFETAIIWTLLSKFFTRRKK